MSDGNTNRRIRAAIEQATREETSVTPFRLSGRGHEARVTLDRSLAAILRGNAVPSVTISGYGPNFHYPRRVFETAAHRLTEELGWSPIRFYEGGAYRADDPAEGSGT